MVRDQAQTKTQAIASLSKGGSYGREQRRRPPEALHRGPTRSPAHMSK